MQNNQIKIIWYQINRFLINFAPRDKRRSLKNERLQKIHKPEFYSLEEFINANPQEGSKTHIEELDIDVYQIKNAYVSLFEKEYSLIHKVHDGKMLYFYESFNYKNNSEQVIFQPLPDSRNPILIEECCDLSSFWTSNYWHFTFEALPKLIAMEKQGYKGKYIVYDKCYVNQILEILKIGPDRIIKATPDKTFLIEKLFVVQPFEARFLLDKQALLANIRSAMLENIEDLEDSSYPKRIYVKRIGTRKPTNETEVIDILSEYNFKIIVPEDLSVQEQIKHFYNAEILIMPHGANSTNTIYMKENAAFFEFFGKRYVNTCMLFAVKLLKLNYQILPEPIQLSDEEVLSGGIFQDFLVNTNLLKILVKKTIQAQGEIFEEENILL